MTETEAPVDPRIADPRWYQFLKPDHTWEWRRRAEITVGPDEVAATVKQRLFRFTGGTRATVRCLHCGWHRSPGWREHQRVFDLSNEHDCAGVETYAHMRRRLAAEPTQLAAAEHAASPGE
jgi:hypothetical protein